MDDFFFSSHKSWFHNSKYCIHEMWLNKNEKSEIYVIMLRDFLEKLTYSALVQGQRKRLGSLVCFKYNTSLHRYTSPMKSAETWSDFEWNLLAWIFYYCPLWCLVQIWWFAFSQRILYPYVVSYFMDTTLKIMQFPRFLIIYYDMTWEKVLRLGMKKIEHGDFVYSPSCWEWACPMSQAWGQSQRVQIQNCGSIPSGTSASQT